MTTTLRKSAGFSAARRSAAWEVMNPETTRSTGSSTSAMPAAVMNASSADMYAEAE